MPLHTLHIPLKTIRDKQRLALRPPETTIRQVDSLRPTHYARLRNPIGVYHEHTPKPRVTDKQRPFLIERQTIRPDLPKRLEEHASLRRTTIIVKRQAPDLIRARHGDEEKALVEREHEAIW